MTLTTRLLSRVFYWHWLLVMGASAPARADNTPSLPKIGPQSNVTKDTEPAEIFVILFKWAGAIVIWLAVAWFGLQLFWHVIKAANEARGGEVSWMEAGKAMVGNVLMFVVFLSLALWYTAAFLA